MKHHEFLITDREGYGGGSLLRPALLHSCCTVAAQRLQDILEPLLIPYFLPAKRRFSEMGDAKFEPATSSL
jgi:hypothetical protein